MSPADAGQVVEIERMGRQTGWAWAPTAHATVQQGGSFTVLWRANHIGRFQFRPVLAAATTSQAAASAPAITVTVYRPSVATQYGPGFYGSDTACGVKLGRRTLGVANRSLPCGTLVALYYAGQTIIVPVIDRGPYANGADWDLTEATGRALGVAGTATIGAVSLPNGSAAAVAPASLTAAPPVAQPRGTT
jgi:rare lipoprotein A (peptidoglycan hydrolase)